MLMAKERKELFEAREVDEFQRRKGAKISKSKIALHSSLIFQFEAS
jgi:hypothetical protein